MTNMNSELATTVTTIGYADHNLIAMDFTFDCKKYEATEYVDMVKTVFIDDEGLVNYNHCRSMDGNMDTWGISVDGREYKLGTGGSEEDDVRDHAIMVFIIKRMKEFLAAQEDLFDWDEEGAAA